jgi:hypothetical protein
MNTYSSAESRWEKRRMNGKREDMYLANSAREKGRRFEAIENLLKKGKIRGGGRS